MVDKNYIREAIVYEHYFWDFYNSQRKEVQQKIDWVIALVRSLEVIPVKFFKHIEGTDGLYEIRIKVGSDIFRIFCCFDEGKLIILLNGFQKKSNKTPKKEIRKAEKIKKQYYENKG